MTSKIFRSTVFVAVVVLLCSLGIVIGVLYSHFTGVQVQQLKDELSLAVTGTEQYGNAFLENVEADRFRVTWIDTDGTVLFDTQVDQTAMENHADREEIREAFATGSGIDKLLGHDSVPDNLFFRIDIFYEEVERRHSLCQAPVQIIKFIFFNNSRDHIKWKELLFKGSVLVNTEFDSVPCKQFIYFIRMTEQYACLHNPTSFQ